MPKLEDLNPRISIRIGATVNLGNYESARADVRLDIDLPPGTTVDDAQKWLTGRLLEDLDTAIEAVIEHIQETG